MPETTKPGTRDKSTARCSIVSGVSFDDPVVVYRTEKIAGALRRSIGESVNRNAIADVLYGLYLPFIKRDPDSVNRNQAYFQHVRKILESEKFTEIKRSVMTDKEKSEEAAIRILSEVINGQKGVRDNPNSRSSDSLHAKQMLNHLLEGSSKEDNGEKPTSSKGIGESPMAHQQALDKAIDQATDESSHGEDRSEDQTSGDIDGGPLPRGDASSLRTKDRLDNLLRIETKELLKMLKGIPELGNLSRSDVPYFTGDYNGYDLGSDLTGVIPTALAYPDVLLYAMFSQSALPKYRRTTKLSKSAKYVLLDKSVSMGMSAGIMPSNEHGIRYLKKEHWSKSAALALAISASKEKSDFYLRLFDGKPQRRIDILKGSNIGEKAYAMNYIASYHPSGDTSVQEALLAACNDLSHKRLKAVSQIILITDAESQINANLVAIRMKDANADLITILVPSETGISAVAQHLIASLKLLSSEFLEIESMDRKDLSRLLRATF